MSEQLAGVDPHDWGPDGPVKGAVLYDAEHDRAGIFMDTASNGRHWMRPVGGGIEWPADNTRTYPIDLADAIRARTAEAEAAATAEKWGL